MRVDDPTAGFVCYKRAVLEDINLDSIRFDTSNGVAPVVVNLDQPINRVRPQNLDAVLDRHIRVVSPEREKLRSTDFFPIRDRVETRDGLEMSHSLDPLSRYGRNEPCDERPGELGNVVDLFVQQLLVGRHR